MIPLLYWENEIKDIVGFSHVLGEIRQDGFFEPVLFDHADDIFVAGYEKALALAFSEDAMSAFKERGWAVVYVMDDEDAEEKLSRTGEVPFGADAVMIGADDIDVHWLRRVFERHYDIPRVILETERTIVRELAAEDLDSLYELYDAPGITDYVEPLYEREREEEYQRDYRKNVYGFYDYGMWGVFAKADGRLIGRCGIDPHERGPELGYIIHPDFQRQGIGYEVSLAIIDHARDVIGLHELWLNAKSANTASVRLALKLGFLPAGGDFYVLTPL